MSRKVAHDQILAGNRVTMQVELEDGRTLQASTEVTEDDLSRWRASSGVPFNIGADLLSMIREDYRCRLRTGTLEKS